MSLRFSRFDRWHRRILLSLTLAMVLATGACAGEEDDVDKNGGGSVSPDPQTPIVIAAGDPIIVGVSAALTGPVASLGLESRDAVVVGIERWKAENGAQIGGHEIEVYVEDDGCFETEVAAFAGERLLGRKGLVGVIGPMCSGGATEAIPVYAEAGIVMISGSATRTDLTTTQPEPRFFFRTSFSNAAEGVLQARYAISQLHASTVYVVDNNDAYGQDLADWAQATLEDGGRLVTRSQVRQGDVDFSDLAGQIASDSPDAVIFEGFNPEAALLYRQLRDAGYGGPFIASDGAASAQDFIEPLGEQAEGVVFAGCISALPEDFLADYDRIHGDRPTTPFAGHLADAAHILLDAVAQVATEQDGSLVIDPVELRDAVRNPKLLVGVSGIIAFDENGDRVGNAETIGLAMCEVIDGKFALLTF
jgi:branched-chain amino acid transport system substrate-binding protein